MAATKASNGTGRLAIPAKPVLGEETAAAGAVPREILERARVEMDRTIDRQVEPYRQKIRELERRRADIDEELKGLYMIVGFYDSVRMQADGRMIP